MRVALCLTTFALGLIVGQAYAQQPGTPPANPPQFKDLKEKASYIVGLNVGNMVKNQELELDINQVMRGMQDALAGVKVNLSPEEIQQAIGALEADHAKKMEAAAAANKQEGDAFMEKNKAAPGVVTLPSGLQYKVLKQGNGPTPKSTDTVTTNYKGTLLNGKVFDSTYDRGKPLSFPVNQVIPGWQEALQLMKVGDRWELYVPTTLGYGQQGFEPAIPPNAALVFDIELVSINPPAEQVR